MLCRSLLTVAAVAVGFLGAEASPCRPTTATTFTDASSTVLSDATTVASATSIAETTSVTVSETALTTSADTTLETIPETTSTTLATTTSGEAPACVETQVIVNPGFDGNNAEPEEWSTNGSLDSAHSVSPRNSLAFAFSNGMGNGYLSQSLNDLNGQYRLSYKWAVFSTEGLMAGFGCTITPYIGDNALPASDQYEMSGWTPENQRWSTGGSTVSNAELTFKIECGGEYNSLTISLEDVTLTRLCEMEAP